MPRKPGGASIQVTLTSAQHQSLVNAAQAAGISVTAYARQLWAQFVPGFPADGEPGGVVPPGKYKRKKVG